MKPSTLSVERLPIQPIPENIRSIQPGGGAVMRLELWWGHWRRWWLRTFRPQYVRRMRERRRGYCADCPHDVVDSRDLKFFQNVCGFSFEESEDRFRWRGRLAVAREALAEVLLLAAPLALVAVVFACLWWYPAPLLASMTGLVVWFFREPSRTVPAAPGLVVAPADGKVVEIEEIERDEFLEGPAVKVGILLSLLNVHVNRAPLEARVIRLSYRPGRFMAAMRRQASEANEQMVVALEGQRPPYRRMVVRQIAGAVARRIVCNLRPGQVVTRGQKFGMIKFGSRTEVILPNERGLELCVCVGSRVRAGSSVLARYPTEGTLP